MAAPLPNYELFTTDVRLTLKAEGKSYNLASIGPDDITPRDPVDLPRCDAEVVMDVDGNRLIWHVQLPDGAVPFDKKIRTITASGPIRASD